MQQQQLSHAERKAAAMTPKPLPARTATVEVPDDGRCSACGMHVDTQSLLCGCNNR